MAEGTISFQWSGINKQGKRVTGVLQAIDSKDAQATLKKQEIELTSIKQKNKMSFSFRRKAKIKPKDILLFTRYLSTMIASGLPILQALDVIGHDQENPAMQTFVTTLRNNIASGKTLAESFGEYPQYFGDLYINLIKAGEKSGTLDKILKRLGAYLEKTEALKRKVKKALMYPIAIIVVAVVVTMVLLIYVVPQFEGIFSNFGAGLPAFTQMVINMSKFLQSYWWLVVGALVAGIWGLRRAMKQNENVRKKIDGWTLKMLIIGPMLQKSIIARFTRTLAITLDAGMPIIESMSAMPEIMGNKLYADAVIKIRNDVMNGTQMSVSMASTQLFPNMVVQMVGIGEASGALADMLNKIADYYEEDVNAIVDNLSSLLEPLIMMVLGVVIGGFVIAMYLPIFKLGSLF